MKSNHKPTLESVLRTVLARNPRASLQEIRHSHPVFQAMSLDHLGLRLGQAIESRHAGSLK